MALAIPPGERLADLSTRPTVEVSTATLAVVIVNFCQWQNTYRLVRQLRHADAVRDRTVRIIVVDNASRPSPIADKLKSLDCVDVISNSSNVGFSAAVNRGSMNAASDWLLLLNPDVSVTDGFLDDVITAIDHADPSAGVIGLRLLDSDGAEQASAGEFPTFFSTIFGLLRPRSRRKCRHHHKRQEVEWVTGGCLLARRECFDALHGLDERYFLYYEDVDFCRRARGSGYSVWFDPQVAVVHHSPLHRRKVAAPLRLVTRHALIEYAQRYWKPWQQSLLRGIVRGEAAIRGLLTRDPNAQACYQVLGELARGVAHPREHVAMVAEMLRPIASAQDHPGG